MKLPLSSSHILPLRSAGLTRHGILQVGVRVTVMPGQVRYVTRPKSRTMRAAVHQDLAPRSAHVQQPDGRQAETADGHCQWPAPTRGDSESAAARPSERRREWPPGPGQQGAARMAHLTVPPPRAAANRGVQPTVGPTWPASLSIARTHTHGKYDTVGLKPSSTADSH